MSVSSSTYQDKQMRAAEAAALIASGDHVAMGMALGCPPGLLAALSERLETGALEDLHLWYFHSMPAAAETVLRYELLDRVTPHCLFMGPIERALIARGEDDGRKVIDFVPVAFSEAPSLFERHVSLDVAITTVSPMDAHG